MSKLILVLLDGCTEEAATENLGYLEHLIEAGQGARAAVLGELPSSSRPIYETIFTGLTVSQHGVTSNSTVRRSNRENLFQLCRTQGLKTAAAAYYWISELYAASPFHPASHRFQLEYDSQIQQGIYYMEDSYPDSHVYFDGEYLRITGNPDFLLIHPMNIDDAGHGSDHDSRNYHRAVKRNDDLLSVFLPEWIKDGYQVVVTADHGMGRFGFHGGNTLVQRLVPLYLFSPLVKQGYHGQEPISQLLIAPLLCRLLEIEGSPAMKDLEETGVDFFA